MPIPAHGSPTPPRRSGLPWLIGIAALAIVVGIATWGIYTRVQAGRALRDRTEAAAIPTVAVIKAEPGPETQELILPGNVQAYYEAPIYARISGYLKVWHTDIGTRVTKGELLAEIDAPEVDQQLRQAEADLVTAEANDRLARITARRWLGLLSTDSVSKQETDEKVGDAAAKDAIVASARANVARLRELEGFKRVLSPFDGVVTARETDIGALINAGSTTGRELFRVAQTDKLRIYVQVPQPYAPVVKAGIVAELHFAEYPHRIFPATLTRTADAINPQARTLLIELQAPNPKGELLPGGYTEVHLKLPSPGLSVRLPANALVFQASGIQVATIDAGGHVALKRVSVGRDFGTSVEIVHGIAPGDMVIINPPDSLVDGETVQIATGPESGRRP